MALSLSMLSSEPPVSSSLMSKDFFLLSLEKARCLSFMKQRPRVHIIYQINILQSKSEIFMIGSKRAMMFIFDIRIGEEKLEDT